MTKSTRTAKPKPNQFRAQSRVRSVAANLVLSSLAALFFGADARADKPSICRRIATDPVIEAHFAQAQSRKIVHPASRRYAGLKYQVTPDNGYGTCNTDVVRASRAGEASGYLDYQCDYNGCAFGSNPRLVERGETLYVVHVDPGLHRLERLFGWKAMPREKQAVLAFRNLANELYEASPDGKAVALCGDYGWTRKKAPREELIAGGDECNSYSTSKSHSIFPSGGESNRVRFKELPPYQSTPPMDYYVDIGRSARVDLDGEGAMERIAPGDGSSGAGCGCERGALAFLDSQNRLAKPPKSLATGLNDLAQNLECDESLDIIERAGQYALVKQNRRGARQIYALSGNHAFEPMCTFVNVAPLQW